MFGFSKKEVVGDVLDLYPLEYTREGLYDHVGPICPHYKVKKLKEQKLVALSSPITCHESIPIRKTNRTGALDNLLFYRNNTSFHIYIERGRERERERELNI